MGEGNQNRSRTRRGEKSSVLVPEKNEGFGNLTMKQIIAAKKREAINLEPKKQKNKASQEIKELEALIPILEKIDHEEEASTPAPEISKTEKETIPEDSLGLNDIKKKKIAYLEAELERQKKLLEFEKSKNSSEEIKKVVENHIKLTEETLNNLKNTGNTPKNTNTETIPPMVPTPVVSGYSYADGGKPEIPTPVPEPVPVATPETTTHTTAPENLFTIGAKISYQGENYTISEIPNEKNKNKYILVHPTGKPIYKLTREQLFKQIENGNAVLIPSTPISPPIPTPPEATPVIPAQQSPSPTFIPQTPEAIELEKKLDDARSKYAEEYKKFLASANIAVKAKRFVFGGKVKDSKIPPELKVLEQEYEKATVEYGNMMFQEKYTSLENFSQTMGQAFNIPLSPLTIARELDNYKQNEIFTRVIIQEQSMLNALKAENLPPKEKSVIRKSLDWYLKQPRWKKLAISTVLSTAVIAGISSGTVVAAGGLATFAGMRATRAVAGSVIGQSAAKAYDWLFKEKSTAKRATEEKKLSEMFKEETFDVSLAKSKKEYADILEREQKAKRNRLITKAMITITAGGLTSYGMGYGLSHLSDNSAEQLQTSGINDNHKPEITETTKDTPTKMSYEEAAKEIEKAQNTTPEELKAKLEEKSVEASKPTDSPTPETIKPVDIAVIQKGEGIEHAFRRQIEADTELAKSLGFKGDVNDTKALHEFSGGAAHRIALEHGYVDKITGEEIRIKTAGDVAYQLKPENGELKVDEMKAGGGLIERNTKGSEFEKDIEEYEYKHTKPSVPKDTTVSKTIPSSYLKVNAEDLKARIEAQMDASENDSDSADENTNDEQLSQTLRKQGYTGDPTDRQAVDEFFKKLRSDSVVDQTKITNKIETPNNTIRTGTDIGIGRAVRPSYGEGGKNHFYDSRFPNMNIGNTPYYFPGLSPGQNEFLNHNWEFFGGNPYDLSGPQLIETYDFFAKTVQHYLTHGGEEQEWLSVKNFNAKEFLKNESLNSEHEPIKEYLEKLAGVTKPKGWGVFHKAETVESYMSRALQKLVKEGGLENFEKSLGK